MRLPILPLAILPFIFFAFPFAISPVFAATTTIGPGFRPTGDTPDFMGVQLPSDQPFPRLNPTKFKFNAVKFQYSLGSSQLVQQWIDSAKKNGYGHVMVSLAKNSDRYIQGLGNPSELGKYCPWDNELEDIFDGYDDLGNAKYHRERAPGGNGYMEFRDRIRDTVKKLNGVNSYEIWNEPNLEDEWTNEGLGAIDAQKAGIFVMCGLKGAQKGRQESGKNFSLVTAAVSPLAPYRGGNDIDFLKEYLGASDKLPGGGIKNILEYADGVGWHANVRGNIQPIDPNPNGFQRVKLLFDSGLNRSKPVWMTEFGWERDNASGVDRNIQSRYIAEAFLIAKTLGDIKAMFVFNFGFKKENPDKSLWAWDIEGEITQECVPDEGIFNTKYKDTDYVIAPSLDDDNTIIRRVTSNTLPDELNKFNNGEAEKVLEVRADVLAKFLPLSVYVEKFLAILKICEINLVFIKISFCSPYISVGNEQLTQAEIEKGKNTEYFARYARSIGDSYLPPSLDKIPSKKDCNIDEFLPTSEGNKQVNDLSTNIGTNVGYFGALMPDLKDHEESILRRAYEDKENLAISQKLFSQDRRPPDIDVRCDEFSRANYPDGYTICNLTPTPTP